MKHFLCTPFHLAITICGHLNIKLHLDTTQLNVKIISMQFNGTADPGIAMTFWNNLN